MKTVNRHSSRAPALLAVLVALLAAAGCARQGTDQTAGSAAIISKPNPTLHTEELRIGPTVIKAEIARTEGERERGLMYRSKLPDGTGMLFIFDSDQRLSFWMKNTLLPLSLAYISSDGVIRQIVDLEPQSLEAIQSERSVRYALEAPRGWFDRAGVKVGDSLQLPPAN